MEKIIKIEWAGQIVLTTKQLAEAYKIKPRSIQKNFDRAKEYFKEGEHYFKLTGESLHQFKRQVVKKEIEQLSQSTRCLPVIAPSTASLFLWTHKGCAHHCKMINTPEAWQMFNELERVYFAVKEADKLQPVQSVLPLAEPKPANVEKICVYILQLSNSTVKIGVTGDLLERARTIERQSGAKMERLYNSAALDRELSLQVEKVLHNKFAGQRLEGEFFSVGFEAACREMERTLAELNVFEPLALPDADLADKLLAVADRLQNPEAKDKILIRVANLLIGGEEF